MNISALVLLLASLITSNAVESNWPQYRGRHASGVSEGAMVPLHWDVEKGENILWRTPIPGLAHSSPIIWNDRVYVATAVRPGKAELKVGLYGDIDSANDQDRHQWRLMAIDKENGKIVWDKVGYEGIPKVKRHTKASHLNSTPATDGRRIAAIFGSEGLFCFDMSGELLWKKDLGPMDSGYYQVPTAQWGFASSPVIDQGRVIVLCDVQTNSFLAAFNLDDGKELWRTSRQDVPTWGSPSVAQVNGESQVLVNGWHHIGAYDFKTGEEIWKLAGGGDIPVPTPIVSGDLAYFTSAHGNSRPMRAIRLTAKGDITPPEIGGTNAAIVWAHARQGNYMQTPIIVAGNLYGCADQGVLTCFDARTGTIRYSERLSTKGEGFTASPVSDGKNLFFVSELGNVYVVRAEDKFTLAANNTLEETCMATPALQDGILYFRTRENLIAIGNTQGKIKAR
jgi:outer membrane protein assembly factor BamB